MSFRLVHAPGPLPLFERQIRAAAAVVPLANIAHGVSFAFAALFILPAGSPMVTGTWCALGVALSLATVVAWTRSSHRDALRIFAELIVAAVLFTALWTWATARTIPAGDADANMLLTGLLGGVIGCGCVTLSTSRALGLIWILTLSVGLNAVFLLQGQEGFYQLAALVAIYDVALVLGVLYLSASFRARCMAEERAEAEGAKVRLLLHDFESGANDWLWETGSDGAFSHVSTRFAESAGMSMDELHKTTWPTLLQRLNPEPDSAGREAAQSLERHLRERVPFHRLSLPIDVAGEPRWWELSGRPQSGQDGWRGTGSDTTAVQVAQARVARLATTDAITGLPNRYMCNVELGARLDRPHPAPTTHLGIVDLDNFKSVNDTLGHPSGDALIAAIAGALRSELRPGEWCARFGGDEFVVLLADGLSQDEALQRFHQLHVAIKGCGYQVAGNVLEVSSSIGVADSSQIDPIDANSLIVAADLALYAAKAAGRDGVQRYTVDMSNTANARAELIRDLTAAIERNEFVVHFQPQIDLADDTVVGLEALVRWNHPQRGLLAPDSFIKAAEESGLIVGIGQLVLDSALAEAATWPAALRLSVNVSPRELLSAGFIDQVLGRLEVTGFPAQRLVLEVTETVMVDPVGRSTLSALRRSGVGISMDDFGTGYSSFSLLKSLPVDEIKIDRSFICPLMDSDPVTRTIVSTIITMTRTLGVRVIAEGVETSEQRDLLRALDCEHYQGYLGSRPMAAGSVTEYLRQRG